MKNSYSRSGSSHLGVRGSKKARETFRKKQLVRAYLNHLSKEDIIDSYITAMPARMLNEYFTDAVKYINSGALVP